MGFTPGIDILPPSQRLLWGDLHGIPTEFTLYDGTAVALHLGHRQSVDFDFFATQPINPWELYAEIPFLRGSTIIQQERNTLTCLVDRLGPVKVSFFGLPHIRRIEPPLESTDNRLKIASMLDLAGTKALVVQQRAEAKDYIDIDSLMRAGIGLPLALSAAKYIFGPGFNAQITLKALSYFDDGDLPTLPEDVITRIIKAVATTDLGKLPSLDNRPGKP